MSNEVRLTFAGDSGNLEEAFARVGASAREMATQVGSSEDAFAGVGRQAGALGESLDRTSGAMSMLSGGVGDIGGAMTAFSDLQNRSANAALAQQQALIAVERAQKDYDDAVKEFGANSLEAREAQIALTAAQNDAKPPTAVQEWGEKLELISPIIMGLVGATDLLILANTALSASFVRTAASSVAARVATIAGTVATGIATAAQWLWNIALTANPIGVVVMAVAALIAVIILIATKTTWFQTVWKAVWSGIVAYIKFFLNIYKAVFAGVAAAGVWLWDKIKAMGAGIKSVFTGIGNAIKNAFKAAFNFVSRAWNNTIGKLSWSVPGWIPGIGGNTIAAPKLKEFHRGGVVPGSAGSEMLAVLQAGERVTPAGGRQAFTLELRSGGARMDDLLVQILARAVHAGGGNVQHVLGS